jgi:superfamily II DNA/RNA helicase
VSTLAAMTSTFADLGLPSVLSTTLAEQGITAPFPIQEATIPDALAGRDVSGRAPTGSGKTLAFGLPILARIDVAEPKRPRALILAPTRELAAQIRLDLAPYGMATHRQVFAVFGGVRYHPQKTWLSRGVDVLVATPGRLEDLIEQGAVDLSDVVIVTVDEADRMADMGFLPDVRRILDKTNRDRQTLMFSATLDGAVGVLIRDYQRDPVRHEAGTVEPETTDAEHHFWLVHHNDKVRYTQEVIAIADRSIVFTRTRHGTDKLARQLAGNGVGAVAMHGGLSQNQRTRALKAFSVGDAQALIATDVAARGIHIDAVASVIHFDPPEDAKDYVHRSGRTARAGASGNIVSLVTGEQRRSVRRMQDKLGMHEPIGKPDPTSLHEHHLDALKASVPLQSKTATQGKSVPLTRKSPKRKASVPLSRKERPGRSRPPERGTRDAGGSPKPTTTGSLSWPEPRPIRTPDVTVPGANTIHVSNLPWSATDEEIAALFQPHGTVVQATVMIDNRGRSKGYALVDMPRAEAGKAADAVNGHMMGDRPLKVRLSR